MERYHIFKLGLAILFYAAYCVRSMLVHGLKADDQLNRNNKTPDPNEYYEYFQGVEGKPGRDYPSYSYIPRTTFTCRNLKSGYYADLETDCQVFHICEDSRKISFLCPNGTIFQQSELICEWWNKVNCTNSPNLYEESAEKLQNDIARRKALRKSSSLSGIETSHGAIMRTEERISTRVRQNKPNQSRSNHRIPNNNEIEQHIEETAESNNRHLANAQRTQSLSDLNKIKQTKKDIEQHTGNYGRNSFNDGQNRQQKKFEGSFKISTQRTGDYGNNEQNRQQKKVEGNFKNNFEFGNKVEKYGNRNGESTFRGNTKFTSKSDYSTGNQNGAVSNIQKKTESEKDVLHNYSASTHTVKLESPTQEHKETGKILVSSNYKKPLTSYKSDTQTESEKEVLHNYSTSKHIVKLESPTPQYRESGKILVSNNYNKPLTSYNSDIQTTQNINAASFTANNHKEQEINALLPNDQYNIPFPTHKSELDSTTKSEQVISNNLANHRTGTENLISSSEGTSNKVTNTDLNSHELETQVTQESSSFVKNSFNGIKDINYKSTASLANHRSTYSDIKDLPYLEAPKVSGISSITPHLVTTQPINSGKPFFGNRVGTTLLPNQQTTLSKYTYLPRGSTTSSLDVHDLFNVGNTDKTLPSIETTTAVTNALPTEPFNVGNTESTFTPNVVPDYHSTTYHPIIVTVPHDGSLNIGKLVPVNEPLFVKKTVPLLYDGVNSTERSVQRATVYGTFSSSSNTPYSPTVPTVTERYTVYGLPGSSSTTRGIPIRFEEGQDRVSLQLSKNVFGEKKQVKDSEGEFVRFNTQVRVKDTTPILSTKQNGFLVTKEYNNGFTSNIEKARPFSKASDFLPEFNKNRLNGNEKPTVPSYQISSPKPFAISDNTEPTSFTTTQATPTFNVYNNVDNMIGVLQEIASYNANSDQSSRPGLVIPPSVGPDTLHSLAQYFANEVQSDRDDLPGDTKDQLTTLLTAMTVHGYNNLFNADATASPTASTTTASTLNGFNTESRIGSGQTQSNGTNQPTQVLENSNDFTTTALPELRQLARNFSLALSSYLNDPDNFKKSLEGLRPTEPPPLEGVDLTDNISNADEELLSFSDQDSKPHTTNASPSPTWGFIIAADKSKGVEDEVKNSLGADLNTADSQSFIPRFNDLQVEEKPQQKGITDLPPNHWTSSPKATTLWQKTLSVNPALVNGHFETTPVSVSSSEEEPNEPELYNQDVPRIREPHSEINYDLRQLPSLTLNSTQVHGILIDFMNTTKLDEHNRLHRLLKKLNTSEEEFLNRMKEIESNPLTKRLILLLISECGADVTRDLKLHVSEEAGEARTENYEVRKRENHDLGTLVHGQLGRDQQDTRALQLLNSLYTIASKFGKKR